MQLEPKEYLLPNNNIIYCFESHTLPLVRLDFVFEAGPAYQNKYLVAGMTNALVATASRKHSSREVAEFMDFRGIVLDRDMDTFTSILSVYFLKKYWKELIPLLKELFEEAEFHQDDFEVERQKKRLQFQTSQQQTSNVASKLFYQSVYGTDHILGKYASLEDYDKVTLEDIKTFYKERYDWGNAKIIISGDFYESDMEYLPGIFGVRPGLVREKHKAATAVSMPCVKVTHTLQDSPGPQTTIRMGRIIPMKWDDIDLARFQILSVILGGYFGSRLMSNIREDKGYTYGIYCRIRLVRDSVVFYITTDVGSQYVEDAIKEINNELIRLCETLVDESELDVVKQVMSGNFLRSVDGIFECAERFRTMSIAHITEQFRLNEELALNTITPQQLQNLAKLYLRPDMLTTVTVG